MPLNGGEVIELPAEGGEVPEPSTLLLLLPLAWFGLRKIRRA